jgi:lipoprotein NlpD
MANDRMALRNGNRIDNGTHNPSDTVTNEMALNNAIAMIPAPRCLSRSVCVTATMAAMLALSACGSGGGVRDTGYSSKSPSPRDRAPKAQRPASRAKPGASVVVRKGDNLYRLAVDNGISPLDLAMWNRIPPPYTIHPGQRLRLSPPSEGRTPPPRVGSAPTRPSNSPNKPVATAPGKPVATAPGNTVSPNKPITAPQANFAWRWPAEGNLVGRFIAGDPTKQGIDIAGQSGAAVRAAADGVVVYSGAGLVGYGELVIVKHSEQWLSAYGHNRARLVNEGQRVKAGEQIAEMGRSGAARDMLHFEVRYNGKPQDPLQYLPKR